MKPLTEKHVQHLAAYMYRTGKAESMTAALGEATRQVEEANRLNSAKTAAAIHQVAARPLQGCTPTAQQFAAHQRSTDRTLRRLTAAVVALERR